MRGKSACAAPANVAQVESVCECVVRCVRVCVSAQKAETSRGSV